MNDDADLLHRFAEEGSQSAFAELVRRHIDLVYAAAMRRTGGNTHASADITQDVFASLARHARNLAQHPALAAWMHTATRNAALKLMISEQRRRVRETEAAALETASAAAGADPNWDDLQPLLDDAIDALPETDRTTLVLRFFERRPFAEIGIVLRVTEDAARMRTDRALDKLRTVLRRRGITSTATALAAVVGSQPLISAPAGLAATIVAGSLGAAGPAAVATALTSFMSAKLITTAVLSAVVAFVVGNYVGLSHRATTVSPGIESVALTSTAVSLREDLQRLETENAALQASVSGLKETNAALAAEKAVAVTRAEEPRRRENLNLGDIKSYEVQQTILNSLRQIAAARDQYQLEHGSLPASVHALVGRGGFIRAIRTVAGEDYSELSMTEGLLTVTTPDGMTITYDPSGEKTTKPAIPPEVVRVRELQQKVGPAINQAVTAYTAANQGTSPPNEQALLPFFATPQEGADFLEFIEAQKAAADL